MKRLIQTQFYILLLGTGFAWFNFIRDLISWLNKKACTLGCSPGVNPFLTPCFYGAIFFTIALGLSILMMKKINKQ